MVVERKKITDVVEHDGFVFDRFEQAKMREFVKARNRDFVGFERLRSDAEIGKGRFGIDFRFHCREVGGVFDKITFDSRRQSESPFVSQSQERHDDMAICGSSVIYVRRFYQRVNAFAFYVHPLAKAVEIDAVAIFQFHDFR